MRRFLAANRHFPIAVVVSFVITIVITKWVGDVTVFSEPLSAGRQMLHEAILANQLPDGQTWSDLGANGTNVRILTVWVAEQIHRNASLPLATTYRLIDVACLFLALMITWVGLQRWCSAEWAVVGLLLLGCLIPLTMFFGYFHPWDRPSLMLWAGLVLFASRGRWSAFAGVYLIAVAVKFDAITAVAVPAILSISVSNWRLVTLRAGVVFALGAGVLYLLHLLAPGGHEARPMLNQILSNLTVARELGALYPPLLAHGLLGLLGLMGWSSATADARRLWVCGILLMVPHILFTNVVEVRAQVGTILCMLPLAVLGIRGAELVTGPVAATGSRAA